MYILVLRCSVKFQDFIQDLVEVSDLNSGFLKCVAKYILPKTFILAEQIELRVSSNMKPDFLTIFCPLALLFLFLIFYVGVQVYPKSVHALNDTTITDFNVAAVGDWGCKPETIRTVNNIIKNNPDLVLGLGDYAYRDDASCWFKIIEPIYGRMKIAIGNHDARDYVENGTIPSPSRLKQYMNHFNLSRQYYSFDYKNVHFVALSVETLYGVGSKQFDFVQRDLQKTTSNHNVEWIVVFYHNLEYSSPSNSTKSLVKLRTVYHPLFEKYGVDLVLQAHNHNYQRSYPLKFNIGNTSNPIISDMNISNYNEPHGQIFTTVGTGGVNQVHNFVGKAPYTVTQFASFGFLNLVFTNNGTKLTGKFLDNSGIVKDQFAITKSK
jgi:Calcineurin-like phosphoesterase